MNPDAVRSAAATTGFSEDCPALPRAALQSADEADLADVTAVMRDAVTHFAGLLPVASALAWLATMSQ